MTRLVAEDLHKSFGGVRALDGVSLSVGAGELVALIGPNGAGKSTCFGVLGGQIRPDRGTVWLDGVAITGRSPRALFALGVGRTFQITAAFASMSVRENVQVGLLSRRQALGRLWGRAAAAHRDEADALLARVGLDSVADHAAAALAYGDLKRLELAVALAGAPSLLLMDEPTAGMAARERTALMALVAGLAEADRLAVLFTEHDMDAVFRHADRILVMSRGRLIAAGGPSEVRGDPAVQAAYLGDEAVFAGGAG